MADPKGFVPDAGGFVPDAPTFTPDAPKEAAAPTPDLIGRAKQFLTAEPPPGSQRAGGAGPAVRWLGEQVLPGSWAQAAGLGASALIPGSGFLPAVGRIAAATGAGAGAGALSGQGGAEGALEGGLPVLGGEALGGLARAVTRTTMSMLGRDLPKIADAIKRIVPEFGGKTPEETVSRMVSGEAQEALSKKYGSTLEGLFKKHGDPVLFVPSYDKLTGTPGGKASEMLTKMQSLRRSLRTQLGDMTRRKQALVELELLDQVEEDWTRALGKHWPAAAQNALSSLSEHYAKGKALLRVFSGGRERILPTRAERLLPSEGTLDMPLLQQSHQLQQRGLKSVLTPEEQQLLSRAIRRGEPNPLKRDIPGKGFAPAVHMSPYGATGYLRHLPHAPRRIGSLEELAADAAARQARRLGVIAGQRAVEE